VHTYSQILLAKIAKNMFFKKNHVNSQTNFLTSMKKCTSLLLLAVTLFFCSCEDNSNYVKQLFTDTQISGAITQCIDSTIVRTLNVLCITGDEFGFYYYADSAYRIQLPPETNSMVDSLKIYGYEADIDTLILDMNRAAEQCGDNIKRFWNPIVSAFTFPNPNLLIRGGNSAITEFVKTTRQTDFANALSSSILIEQFNTLNVIARWDDLQKRYFEETGEYSSISILIPAVQQLSDGFFRKMALEEEALRKEPALRGPTTGLLYKVFENL